MEIEVIKESKLELEMIIHGENHSLCNVLRKYLMEDDDVEYAVYGIDHPLTGAGKPVMTIKTKRSKRPRNSLLKAATRLKEETAEFKELIEEL
ncbi:DNA-directed RNA polymerase subunit L RpoL [Methanobrevibacter ruminantium M1]|uniref:DNA-directed RNA polymerase subunit Rpo11 n=1 Tax=Methanobrevibacter ruminantium (strain ATCC 35063 / DSM 1093 / JCM 13430 / OCM 146 / M1) TaxID=634498 RepID=D3DYV1_METRM|nr:DNA-directed RNA polymerase subunit L [Methanobrevibacter ruminantium]ADC46021.1 DNA-directed RNA polymerase subunit L RpoL [Methanobrevibacter ruminantium M1]